MNSLQTLIPRNCPVCGASPDRGKIYLKPTVDHSKLTDFSFASRKAPEFMCYRLVRCGNCAVVFASEAPEAQNIHRAYDESAFDSSAEAELAAQSYLVALAPYLKNLPERRAVLEIGTGTGVFLEKLHALGFQQLVGVEPSRTAIEAASPHAKPWIRHGIFRGTDFPDQSFSLICCFMTLEHVPDPLDLVLQCRRLLIPGGMLALVTHSHRALINRLLGRWSPIVDIEHLQLFDIDSLRFILHAQGFQGVVVSPFSNTYCINYWERLLPLPRVLHKVLQRVFTVSRLGERKISLNVGNIFSVGWR